MQKNIDDLIFIKGLLFGWVFIIKKALPRDIEDEFGHPCWFKWFKPLPENPLTGYRMLLFTKMYSLVKIKRDPHDDFNETRHP